MIRTRSGPNRRKAMIEIGMIAAGMGAGCGGPSVSRKEHRESGRPISIVATTALIGDLIRNIGSEQLVKVVWLMGEGVDPHLYKGSPRDVRDLAEADMVFANGLHLEGKLIGVLQRLGKHKPVHLLGDELSVEGHGGTDAGELASDSEEIWIRDDGVIDPHCWFDVSVWRKFARRAFDILAEFDTENREIYEQRFVGYDRQLEALDVEIREVIGRIEAKKRLLITSHDAFRYFGRAYGIQVEGIQGLSTESEVGVRRTNHLVDLVVSRQIPAVFVETSVSDDNVQAIVEGARARGHEVHIGGSLFSDAPGADGTPEGTYLGMMRHNVRTFARSIQGS